MPASSIHGVRVSGGGSYSVCHGESKAERLDLCGEDVRTGMANKETVDALLPKKINEKKILVSMIEVVGRNGRKQMKRRTVKKEQMYFRCQ